MEPVAKKRKISVSEGISKSITCCLWELTTKINHYAYEAVLLPCGGNACKECVENLFEKCHVFLCHGCRGAHCENLLKINQNPIVKHVIDSYVEDLKEELFSEIEESIQCLEDEKVDEDLELRFDNIEYELETRVESLINGLHEYREEVKRDLAIKKRKYKEVQESKGFNKMKARLEEFMDITRSDNGVDMNYEKFMETHKLLNESKAMLKKYMNELNEIKLNYEPNVDYKDFVGELNVPFWRRLLVSYDIDIEFSRNLARCVYSKSRDLLIFSDLDGFLISNDRKSDSFERIIRGDMKKPFSLCLGKNDQLFVFDITPNDKKILIFDEDLIFRRKIKLQNDIIVDGMSIDLQDERNFLYMANKEKNEILIMNIDNGLISGRIEIDSPKNIEFTKDYIYVISSTDYEEMAETNQLKEITKGSNCIFILNKTHEIIDKISFENWLQPIGLSIQEDYILTVAHELDNNKSVSNEPYLNVIKGKDVVRKYKLEDHQEYLLKDFIIFDDQVMFLYHNEGKIFHFRKYF